jgi:ATP-dependent exoDNAse (exonuclease V) alpha subunit
MYSFDNEQQQRFLRLQREGSNIFLTGKAGTGKTTLLKHLISTLREAGKKVVIVAPTGIAALQAGGMTIHRFFRLAPSMLIEERKILPSDGKPLEILKALDVLLIDEISMVRADLFDAIDICMRKSLKDERPFAGKQVIMVGDVFQIPPVVRKEDVETLQIVYKKSVFFFDSKAYHKLKVQIVELQEVYRQQDIEFLSVLDAIRINAQTPAQLNVINQRYDANLALQSDIIELTTRNDLAENRNKQELSKINEELRTFEAEIVGKFEESLYPTEKTLHLKIGAQVMFIRNHQSGKWANGTIGKVLDFIEIETSSTQEEEEDTDFLQDTENEVAEVVIKVLLENGETVFVSTYTWEKIEYEFDKEKQTIVEKIGARFTQYPLKLAWAITIHKSQGLTFERVCLNFGSGAFAAGQAYVALSRCKTLEGLQLRTRLLATDIKVDADVMRFYKEFFSQ